MAFSFKNRFRMPKIQGNIIKFFKISVDGRNFSVAKSTSYMLTRKEQLIHYQNCSVVCSADVFCVFKENNI